MENNITVRVQILWDLMENIGEQWVTKNGLINFTYLEMVTIVTIQAFGHVFKKGRATPLFRLFGHVSKKGRIAPLDQS